MWFAALVGLVNLFFYWVAPDTCLDRGGAFDYDTWECGYDVYRYKPYALFTKLAFWFPVLATIAAVTMHEFRDRQGRPGQRNAADREQAR